MTGVAGIIVKDCYRVLLALLTTSKPDTPMLQWQLSIKFQQYQQCFMGRTEMPGGPDSGVGTPWFAPYLLPYILSLLPASTVTSMINSVVTELQCFDTVGWAAGRASGL